jgi:hypothetical protein
VLAVPWAHLTFQSHQTAITQSFRQSHQLAAVVAGLVQLLELAVAVAVAVLMAAAVQLWELQVRVLRVAQAKAPQATHQRVAAAQARSAAPQHQPLQTVATAATVLRLRLQARQLLTRVVVARELPLTKAEHLARAARAVAATGPQTTLTTQPTEL